jgi:acetyl-CoA synthetase
MISFNLYVLAHRKSLLKHDARSYDEVYNTFKWDIPEYYNIGVDVCDKHIPHRRFQDAILYEDDKGLKK